MSQFTVPKTIEEATGRLGGLEKLITASKWERAAIVYAFTRDGQAEPNRYDGKYTIKDFAALGIAGLRATETVRRYRECWKQQGDTSIGPGSRVRLPKEPFPTFLDSLNQAGRSTRGEKKSWRESILNQAEKALQIVNSREITVDELETLEEVAVLYAKALKVAYARRSDDDLKPGSPAWLATMRAGLREAYNDSLERHGKVA